MLHIQKQRRLKMVSWVRSEQAVCSTMAECYPGMFKEQKGEAPVGDTRLSVPSEDRTAYPRG